MKTSDLVQLGLLVVIGVVIAKKYAPTLMHAPSVPVSTIPKANSGIGLPSPSMTIQPVEPIDMGGSINDLPDQNDVVGADFWLGLMGYQHQGPQCAKT